MIRHLAAIGLVACVGVVSCTPEDTCGCSQTLPPTTPYADIDCAAMGPAMEGMVKNTDLLIAISDKWSVDQWPPEGAAQLSEFAAPLEALRALQPAGGEANGAIDRLLQMNAIIERGYAGDPTADADLHTMIGAGTYDILWVRQVLERALGGTVC